MTDKNSASKRAGTSAAASHDFVDNSGIIAETASDAVITINEDSTIMFVNRAAVNIFGYSIKEMMGAQLTMLMPEYLRHLHRSGFKSYIETGERHISWEAVELPGLHKSGREISLELSFGEFQKDGARFFTGIARDITRRKRDERRLNVQHSVTAILAEAKTLDEASPRLLESICRNLGWQVASLWLVLPEVDELHYVANWRSPRLEAESEKASRVLRFGRGEGLPGKVWETKKPLWVPAFASEDFPRSPIASRENLHSAFSFPIIVREEVLGVIELFAEDAGDADGPTLDTLRAIGSQIGQFIERKNAEREREQVLQRAQSERLEAEAMARQLASLQRVTDAALSYLSVEEVIAESLDRIRDVLGVDTVAILLLETKGEELIAWAAQGLEREVEEGVRVPVGKGFAGKVVSERQPVIVPDVDHEDVYNPLFREKGIKSLLGVPLFVEGRTTGVVHVGTLHRHTFSSEDVRLLQLTADRIALLIENARLYQVERTARAEAESASRAKDDFLTILSHELRTPLTPIIGWVHMMQDGMLPDTEFDNALSIVNRNASTLKRLINDLLDMSAILSGKMNIEAEVLTLSDVLSDAVDTMADNARDANVMLALEVSPEAAALKVTGDRNRLNQAFCNLIHNAVKFSPAGGHVRITCEAADSEATVGVHDQGEGISPDFLPHVFERFRQADASRTRAYGGLGLGLALVKSFVEAHGGTVEARSGGNSKGSLFIVRLPRQDARLENTRSQEPKPDRIENENSRRVLVVDDEPDTLEMLAATFRSRGYATTTCDSADEALQLSEGCRFDILISDIAMPGMDGLQLISALRKMKGFERIAAIALTGYASATDASSALAAGFDMHLPKPIDPAELVATVEDLWVAKRKQIS